jgi:hypothetical protein
MDIFVGYEQMQFERRMTQKFAAASTNRNIIGSPGAETWETIIGQSSAFVTNQASTSGVDTDTDTADWMLHDPTQGHGIDGTLQFHPSPQNAANQPIQFVCKVGYAADNLSSVKLYYTTDGTSYPEGSGNKGWGRTQVISLTKIQNATAEAGGTPEWWRGTVPALPSGTKLRYKIGGYTLDAAERSPSSMDNVRKKERMETIYRITGFNGTTVTYYPHNDKGEQATGLPDGYHMLRTRAFLPRTGQASIYRTTTQTFYLDQSRPAGIVKFPSTDGDTIGGNSYGVVALSDQQTTEVWFQIQDTNGSTTWAKAVETIPPNNTKGTSYTKEWHFDYKNIPASGVANILVRFKEATSSANNSLSDVDGWYTTVTRTVNTGTPVNFRIRFPETDGTVVSDTYVAKVYFDKSLSYTNGSEIPESQILGEFSIFLASAVSGEPDDEVLHPRSGYGFNRHETGTESAITFTFPNLFTGDPDFLHHVRAVFQRGAITLSTNRLVKAAPGPLADSDNDGLPDFWENTSGLDKNNPDGVFGAAGDKDFDGLSNFHEYLFNLAPNLPDPPPVPAIRKLTNTVELDFPVFPGRRYRVFSSPNLTQWDLHGGYLSPTSAALQTWVVPTATEGRSFYRVEVSLP